MPEEFIKITEEFSDLSSIGMFITNTDGSLLKVNKALSNILLAESIDDLMRHYKSQLLNFFGTNENSGLLLSTLIETEDNHIGSHYFMRTDGSYIKVALHIQKIKRKDRLVFIGYVLPSPASIFEKSSQPKPLENDNSTMEVDDFYYILDPKGEILSANSAFYTLIGVEELNFVKIVDSQSGSNMLYTEFRKKDSLFLSSALQNNTARSLAEKDLINGIAIRRIALYNNASQLQSIIVFGHDISQMMLAEKFIITNQANLQAIIESAQNGICLISKDYLLVKINSQFSEFMSDYFFTEVKEGDDAHDIFPKSDREKWNTLFNNAFSGIAQLEEIILNIGGFDHYFECTVTPVRNPLSQEITGLTLFLSDITERKIAEDALKESESRFRQVTENTNDAFVLANEKGILYVNPALEKLLGINWEEALRTATLIEDSLHEADRERYFKILNSPDPAGNIESQQFRLITSKNDVRQVWIRSFPIINNKGNIYRNLTVISDLTEQEELKNAISNSQLQQKAILDNIPYLSWLKDNNGKYISVNGSFASFFRKDLTDIIGKTDMEIFPEEIAKRHVDYDLEVKRDGRRKLKEDNWTTEHGIRWVETFTAPILSDNGTLLGITGIARDISDRKAMEETIIKNEEHFRSLLQYSSDAISILDENGIVIFESSLRNRISDFPINELLGKPYQEIVHPDDIPIFTKILEELILEQGTQIKREYRSLHKNKKWIYVESIFSNHLNNPSINGIVVNTRDVSDRKMSELKERVYHDNLIFLSNSALDLLGLSGRNDIFKYIGDKLHSFLEDAVILVSSHSDDDDNYTIRHIAGLEQFEKQILELIGTDLIGLKFHSGLDDINLENSGTVTIFNGPIENFGYGLLDVKDIEIAMRLLKVNKIYNITIARDNKLLGNITVLTLNKTIIKFKHIIETFVHQVSVALHRSQLEFELIKAKTKAEESDMLKTAFLANMSHEIRTPMNGILGFAEMLNDENISDGNRKKYVEIINNNGKMLMSLIDDIIDFAKIEAGQIKILNQEFSLNSLLTQVHSSFLSESLKKEKTDVKLRIRKAFSNEDCFIQTDPNRLRQILTNLVGNAFKFTQSGFIEFGYLLPESGIIEFYVKDTGIGIQADKINLIFERFVQADYSRSRKYSGSGLGLAISKGFVELLGGKMWAESEVDIGSTFFFTIPYLPASNRALDEAESRKPKSDFNWFDKVFLIAEDDKFSFKLLEGFLRKTKAEILHAEDGAQAVTFCRENKAIDLVLMDVQMPEMNGMEATRLIKGFNKKLPIIAQTANAIAEEKQRCFEAGFDDFITKPINISELFSKIDKWLSEK